MQRHLSVSANLLLHSRLAKELAQSSQTFGGLKTFLLGNCRKVFQSQDSELELEECKKVA